MAVCEACWNEAYRQVQLLGGNQVEHYERLIRETEHEPPLLSAVER